MKVVSCFLVVLAALPLFAQSSAPSGQTGERGVAASAEPPRPSPYKSFIELQYYNFGNFFQAPEGQPQRDVNVLGAAYRGIWIRPHNTPDVYGRLSVLRYSGGASETSYTGQIGVMKYGPVHWYDVAVDHTRNGYSFDIEETRASANITTLWGHYSYGIGRNWRVGAETYDDWTSFDVDIGQESSYYSLGAIVRYNGFGDIFKPRAGVTVGKRDSEDPGGDLDDRYWYIQLGTEPIQNLDLSVRYRDRVIDYDNIAREDERNTWQLRATWRPNDRIRWDGWYRFETIDSSRVGRDFDRNTASVTLTYGF